MVRPARLCPYCEGISEPTVLEQHTMACGRHPDFDTAMEREARRFALSLGFALVVASVLVGFAIAVNA